MFVQLNSLKKQEDEVRSRLANLEQHAALERSEVRRAVAGLGQLCMAVRQLSLSFLCDLSANSLLYNSNELPEHIGKTSSLLHNYPRVLIVTMYEYNIAQVNNLAEKVVTDREAMRRMALLRPAAGGVGRATGASEETAENEGSPAAALGATDVTLLGWEEKLALVEEFLLDKSDVARMASGELPIPATDNEIRQRVKRMSDQILARILRQMRDGSDAALAVGARPESDDESPQQSPQRRPLAPIKS